MFDSQWRGFEKYTHELGPIFMMRSGWLGRKLTFVVGTYQVGRRFFVGRLYQLTIRQAASDIMEKQGAHIADRPRTIAAGETLSGGMRTLLLPYQDRLKRLRK